MSDIAKLFRKICGENIATKERVFYSCSRIYKWFLADIVCSNEKGRFCLWCGIALVRKYASDFINKDGKKSPIQKAIQNT